MSEHRNAALNGRPPRLLLPDVPASAFGLPAYPVADRVGSRTMESDALTSFGNGATFGALSGVGAHGGIGARGGVATRDGVSALGGIGALGGVVALVVPS